MTDDSTDPTSLLDRRAVRIGLIFVGVILAILAPVVIAELGLLTDPYPMTEGTPLDAFDGPQVILEEDVYLETSEPIVDGTINLHPHVKIMGDDGGFAEISGLADEWITLENVSAPGRMSVDVYEGGWFSVTGSPSVLEHRGYSQGQHAVSLETDSATEIEFETNDPKGYVMAVDPISGSTLNVSSYEDGTAKITVSQDAHVYAFVPASPEVVVGTESPSGILDTFDVELSVDVIDDDFGHEWSDEINVTFEMNGLHAGEDTLSVNGTASTSGLTAMAGENTWSVTAEDSYGETDTAEFNFTTPETLEIRDELTGELLNETNVTVEFYFTRDDEPDLIVEREADNGTVDMTGLPVVEPFIVVANAENYFTRRIFVSSLFETQTVFMIDEAAEIVEPEFVLTDFTGKYDVRHTVLEIQRSFDGDWLTVEGDFFGAANQFPAQLEYNERHRMVITNIDTGDSRVLGTFTPVASTIVDIEVLEDGEIITEPGSPALSLDPGVSSLPAAEGVTISAVVAESGEPIDSYTLTFSIDEEVLAQFSGGPGGGSHEQAFNLTEDAGGSLEVELQWAGEEGSEGTRIIRYSIRPYSDNQYALIPALLGLSPDGDPPNAMTSLLVMLVALLATGYSSTVMGGSKPGVIGVGVVGAGAMMSWVPVGWLIAAAVTWIVFATITARI